MVISRPVFPDAIPFRDNYPDSRQQQNIKSVMNLAKKFHHDAGISYTDSSVTESCIVLESGHQPNFFPHSGVWKKALLLNYLKNHLKEHHENVIALFGFADQNISTAKLLYENHIPSVNKTGAEKIGIKLNDEQRWQCFNAIQKPEKETWDAEIRRILSLYSDQAKLARADVKAIRDRTASIAEITETCYDRANNFAELHAFIFSKICTMCLDLDISFFRYSDIQAANVFDDEVKNLIANRETYIKIYNQTIQAQKLEIPPVAPDYLPFWYHCSCGGKVALSFFKETQMGEGICPVCKTRHAFSLNRSDAANKDFFKRTGLVAVARNIVFSEGLNTAIFISGSGGGMQYGAIAGEIERTLGTHIPTSVVWRSKDQYIGIVHKIALKDFQKNFHVQIQDISDARANEKISEFIREIHNKIRTLEKQPEGKKDLQKYQGIFRNASTQVKITRNIFTIVPSFFDVMVNIPCGTIKDRWMEGISKSRVEIYENMAIFHQDIVYPDELFKEIPLEDIPKIFRTMQSLVVES